MLLIQDVYPPLKPSQYKLFTDQENDRLMLLASHLNEVVSTILHVHVCMYMILMYLLLCFMTVK